jgi:hypothetical protein
MFSDDERDEPPRRTRKERIGRRSANEGSGSLTGGFVVEDGVQLARRHAVAQEADKAEAPQVPVLVGRAGVGQPTPRLVVAQDLAGDARQLLDSVPNGRSDAEKDWPMFQDSKEKEKRRTT